MSAEVPRSRLGVLFAILGSALLLPAILVSQSSSGAILGRYSVGLATAALLNLVLLAGGLILMLRSGTSGRVAAMAARTPDFLVVNLIVFPLPVFLLLWFLFPVPILDRWNAFAGLCLLMVFPGVFLIGARNGKARSEALKGTMVASASLLICLIAAELAVRAVVPGSYFNPRLGLIPYSRHTIMVDLPGVSMGGTLSTNSWGLRGEEPPEDWDAWTTIVTVGGSTTADYYLDDARTWSHVLQETLRESSPLVWVGNGGIPMHSSETHDYFLREVVAEIRPDIVVFLVGINDIGQFMRGSVALDEPPLPERGARAFLFAQSRLLQALYKAKKVYIEGATVISETSDPEFELLPMTTIERPLPEDLGTLLPDPRYYERRILRLIETCRDLNVTPVFLTQPLLYDNTDYWRGIQGGCSWLLGSDSIFSAATHWLMLDYLNRQLIGVCHREGVACFDLASRIPHDRSMFYDAMHFTEAGSDRIGRLTGKYLLSRGILAGT
jgi:lysophospholipase L1-like esterase